MIFRAFLVLVLLSNVLQGQSPVIDSLNATLTGYTQSNKVDSAYLYVMKFSNRKDISNTDKFYANYAHCQLLSANGAPRRSLKLIFESIALIEPENSKVKELTALAHNFVGDNYFTLQNYDSAKYYCNLAKNKISLQFKSAIALNYEILGYCYFLEKSFIKAIDHYKLAIEFRDVKNNYCNANTIYSKIGQCYLRLGNEIEARRIIEKCIKTADSCGHIRLRSASRFAMIDFYTYKKMYKEAFDAKIELDKINHEMEDNAHKIEVEELEAKYETKLKEQENVALMATNENKSLIITIQQRILIIAIVSILAFLILTLFIIRTSRQRRKLYEALENQKSKTELQNKDLERQHILNQKIFSVISHDFKGPMLSLGLLLDTYKLNGSAEMLTKYIFDVRAQLNNVNNVLNNLLNWTKTEINLKTIDNVKSRLLPITSEIITQLSPSMNEKLVKVNVHYQDTIEIELPADILKIVIRNILANAIKFSHELGSIDFYFNSEWNSLIISDAGIGMTKEKIDSLFKSDVMSQLGTKNEAGFGMGLYIVSELLNKYNCSISVESKENEGSRFLVNFPNRN
jgi:two-component system, sensor histidine kinase and response regulator